MRPLVLPTLWSRQGNCPFYPDIFSRPGVSASPSNNDQRSQEHHSITKKEGEEKGWIGVYVADSPPETIAVNWIACDLAVWDFCGCVSSRTRTAPYLAARSFREINQAAASVLRFSR